MDEGPRLIQHWKTARGGRPSMVFLFSDGIAIINDTLEREQEMVRALRDSASSSPHSVLGAKSWWLPFNSIRRLYISRENRTITVESNRGWASASFTSAVDVDYFVQMLTEDIDLVTWQAQVESLGFRYDSVRMVLASLVLIGLLFVGFVTVNVLHVNSGATGATTAPLVNFLYGEQGLGLSKWGAIVISALPALALTLLIVLRGLMAPRFHVYELTKSATLLNLAAAAAAAGAQQAGAQQAEAQQAEAQSHSAPVADTAAPPPAAPEGPSGRGSVAKQALRRLSP